VNYKDTPVQIKYVPHNGFFVSEKVTKLEVALCSIEKNAVNGSSNMI